MMTDLESLEGLYVGQLDESELWMFRHAVEDGLARVSYSGPGGFLGLGKVEIIREIDWSKANET